MSTHIAAKKNDIAKTVLLPGDPLRAKFIAEHFLENAKCYSTVRGMFGFTGTYKGVRVSVQGTGMGQPSLSIYVNELFQFYNVKNAIRVGTAGAIQKNMKLRDTVLVQSACTDSSLQTQRFRDLHFAPTADFSLLMSAYETAKKLKIPVRVGSCASSDLFYDENANWKTWQKFGVLAIEMEAAELFTLAAKFSRRALAILTVSDNIITGEQTTAKEREQTFSNMIKIALETAKDFD